MSFAADQYDAIVIGGGPAGSTAAAIIAEQNFSVLLLEGAKFPRFKVGESLIPASHDTLARLGMIETLQTSHFPQKHSVQFITESGKETAPFYFSETDPSPRAQTWQVLRSEFDQLLLDNARSRGVEVVEQARVKDVIFEDDRAVGVEAMLEQGRTRVEARSRVIVDASGQRSLLGRKLKLRKPDPDLRMVAMFSHFEGGERGEGIDEGATLIIHTEGQNSWFWYIPLPNDHVSIGVVGPIDYLLTGRSRNPELVFQEEIARCRGLDRRLKNARRVRDVHVLNDFSYTCTSAAGDGWVLAGDALGFLDPMYSSGVVLALRSAELAGDCVVDALQHQDPSRDRLGAFGPTFFRGLTSFRKLVRAFYTKAFSFGHFLARFPEHRLAIIDILVGDVFDRDFQPLFRDLDAMLAELAQPPAGRIESGKVTP